MSLLLSLALLLAAPAARAETAPSTDEAAAQQAPAGPTTRVTAGMVLRVADREAALQATIDAAEARGGWFSALSPAAVTVRVPVDQTEALLEQLRGLGELAERSFDSVDLGAQLADLDGQVRARQVMLVKYEEALAQASAGAVVSVQREITRLVAEIERLEGQRRLLRNQVTWSEVTVAFTYRERTAPVRDGSSSFAWINSVNVADLLGDLQWGRRADRSGVAAVAPDGFAPYGKPGRFQAVSPDDVIYRVRSAKNKPVADLDFWVEALRGRMVAAGYKLVGEQAVTANGLAGHVLELGAANGEQDQAYVVGLFVHGRRLVLVEATGEAQRFAAHRQAVLDAIGAIAP